jgi:hypothetical protein
MIYILKDYLISQYYLYTQFVFSIFIFFYLMSNIIDGVASLKDIKVSCETNSILTKDK